MQSYRSSKFDKSVLISEIGAAGLFVLLGLSAFLGYFEFARPHILEHYPRIFDTAAIVSLLVISVFAIGCKIHLHTLGDRSKARLRKDVISQVKDISHLVVNANNQIYELEQRIAARPGTLSPKGHDSLSVAKRLVRAMERRIEEVSMLLRENSKASIIDAYEVLNSKLSMKENSIERLIDANPIAPIEAWQWAPMLDKLFTELEGEEDKLAA